MNCHEQDASPFPFVPLLRLDLSMTTWPFTRMCISVALMVSGCSASHDVKVSGLKSRFDLSGDDVEPELDELVGKAQADGLCQPEYTVTNRTAVLRTATGRGGVQTHDMDDFSVSSLNVLLNALDAKQAAFPKVSMALLFEYKMVCDPSPSLAKKQAAVESLPATTPRSRSGKLLQQHEAALDRITDGSLKHLDLMRHWKCTDQGCTNLNSYCFLDGGEHYVLLTKQQEVWANAIARGEATVLVPPMKLLKELQKDGPVGAMYRRTAKTARAQQATSTMDDIKAMMKQTVEFSSTQQMMAMADKISNIQQPQQQSTLLLLCRRTTNQTPPTPPPPPPPVPPVQAPDTTASTRPRSSSPVYPEEEDADTLDAFFHWKINTIQNAGVRQRWQHAAQVVIDQAWDITFLRQMINRSSEAHRAAMQTGYFGWSSRQVC
ncbi:uncharacterized protein BDZ99DRAFT_497096 [Mytilinidion resinicola]|uniref:Uncharacterized protein n=1 Tax=Mytilinidion resinicola TaxID=574789 RepID=A0A6A6YVE3_9PEZI|nr:uncharacterized protein BDZ99DRAFT_497096 [Mytilinidion resinicola]KAF2812761.1 hypothetical protein BDZ99DRAFT_497096 [Mytilinidion resinicola]